MNAKERANLAEQLRANPLFALMFENQESHAIDRMVYATDETTRLECALRVQAIRSLREDCQSFIDDNDHSRKAAPA